MAASNTTTVARTNGTALRLLDTPFEAWAKDSLTRWQPASFPTGDGGNWTWAEPKATVGAKNGTLEVAVAKFTRSHDQVQIFDNPKHLLACAAPIKVPDEGVLVETTMNCTMHNQRNEE